MLVAAISPADQNFGETLSTLKFAQRAKMIKNQAVKNEDTSGSFDALRREVTSLRQKLLAAQQLGPASTSGAVPRPLGNENVLSDISGAVVNQGAADGGGGNGATDVKSEALLANALRRARAAGEAQRGAGRRVESLLAAIEKSEKDVMQLKMVIKFRDGTIAAQRKKDSDQERSVAWGRTVFRYGVFTHDGRRCRFESPLISSLPLRQLSMLPSSKLWLGMRASRRGGMLSHFGRDFWRVKRSVAQRVRSVPAVDETRPIPSASDSLAWPQTDRFYALAVAMLEGER